MSGREVTASRCETAGALNFNIFRLSDRLHQINDVGQPSHRSGTDVKMPVVMTVMMRSSVSVWALAAV